MGWTREYSGNAGDEKGNRSGDESGMKKGIHLGMDREGIREISRVGQYQGNWEYQGVGNIKGLGKNQGGGAAAASAAGIGLDPDCSWIRKESGLDLQLDWRRAARLRRYS